MRLLYSALAMIIALSAAAVDTDDDVRERIKPFGSVCVVGQECPTADAVRAGAGSSQPEPEPVTAQAAATAAAAAPMMGSEVYGKFCTTCHAAGVAGAPLVHDAEQWAPRLAKGEDVLMETTLKGMNAMPPRGMCMACSEAELRAAIEFMSSPAP